MPPRKRRHAELEGRAGGHLQRADADEGVSAWAGHAVHSPLAFFLLSSYLLGSVSLPFIVQVAVLAYRETPGHPDLKWISGFGGSGCSPNTMRRDMFHRMLTFAIESAIYSVRLPVKVFGLVRWTELDIIYPHELFANLYASHPAEFARRMFAGQPGNISKFWDSQTEHPNYHGHPMHSHPYGFRTKAVPLFTHGDDVGAVGISKIWSKAIDCVSWGSLLCAPCKSEDRHNLIWLVYNVTLVTLADGNSTLKMLWRHLVWSLFWLYKGVWPSHDPDGNPYTEGIHASRKLKPLAGKYFGQIWVNRWDLDWGQSQFKLHNNDGNACMSCDATMDGCRPWTDCRDPPYCSWEDSVYSNASHAVRFGDERHRFMRGVLPGVGVACNIPDILHCLWLGCNQYFLGAALALLTHFWLPGSFADNLKIVFARIKAAYKDAGVALKDQYPTMKVTQYKPSASVSRLPKLKGTGRQCKGLAKVLPSVFEHFMNMGDDAHQLVLYGLRCILEVDQLYDAHYRCYKFPEGASKRLIEVSFAIAQTTTALINVYLPLYY